MASCVSRTDLIGEMEVQAFVAANISFRHNWFILAATVLVQLDGLRPLGAYAKRLKAAYQRGKQARNLFSVRYDHYLDQKVEKLRTDLGIN